MTSWSSMTSDTTGVIDGGEGGVSGGGVVEWGPR